MVHTAFLHRLTATVLSCTLSLSAENLPASGQMTDDGDICYTLTETSEGWCYMDAAGNPLPESTVPYNLPAPHLDAPDTTLPARFDLREENALSSVKKQIGGTCWAYGAFGAIESNMIKKGMGDASLDLSEAHLLWFARCQGAPTDPSDPLFGDGVILGTDGYEIGGGLYWVTAPLAAWEGVVYESDVPSHSEKLPMDESLRFNSVAHLQNMRKFSKNDVRTVKETLMEKGALGFSYFIPEGIECVSEQCGYYQTRYDPSDPNHSEVKGGGHTVTLVGWDDNFPKENFIETPPGDGAWILKNSWGENASRTEKGFFYLSYYEKSIGDITLFDMEPANNYSGIYQYDGDSQKSYRTGHGADTGFEQANVFEARQDENITAIGFYINDRSMPYEAEIYALEPNFDNPRDGKLLTSVSGQTDYIGYYTIPLSPCCTVQKGQLFSVVVKTAPCQNTTCHFDAHCYAPRTSFYTIYNADGEEPWKDCYDNNRGNVNVKAYTSNGIMISEANFPNQLIRENLSKEYDTDGNSFLSVDEAVVINGVPYDINGDGLANAIDLTLLKRAVLGTQTESCDYHWYEGDCNNDGNLDDADVQTMLHFLIQQPE